MLPTENKTILTKNNLNYCPQASELKLLLRFFSSLGFYLNFSQIHTFIPRIELSLHPKIEESLVFRD